MGVDFFVGEVNSQSAAAKQMAAQYVQFSGVLKDSVSHFMSAPLSGKTYDSAKQYFSAVYPTLASGFILVCEALIEAHSKFPEEFQSQVDTCDVIEDQLKAVIAQGNLTLQSMTQRMDKEKEPNQGLEQRYMHVQAAIRESEEKLQKLYAFHASSPDLFADFEAQLANFDAGLAEVEKGAAWNASSGTFDLGRMNMSWVKPISRAWDKRQKKIEAKTKDIELENEKIGYQFDEAGNLIGVFVNGEFDSKRTREIQGMIQLQDIQGVRGLGSGFLDQWANNNGKSIFNKLFGERQVNSHLSNTSGYANGQMLADVLSLAQGGAEFVGGFLWMFGGTAGSIATFPVTGGASAAAIPAINTSGLAISGHGAGVLRSAWGSLGEGYGSENYPNGKYEPSPKHDPKSGWGSPNSIPTQEVGQKLLDTAYTSKDKKQLYNFWDGKLVKFQPDTTGSWHAYDVVKNVQRDVPADVLRAMQKDGLITNAQYRKLIKQ
ncbi:T7SS effector LXG polymorphic toxin [Enterococcus sp. AZ192]|uniref:T7SS effector LXG polymorphic toxin n=1 Tax=unclassified Enterococcus TaxID=2608891 RepID=UPI003D27F41F